MNWSYLFKHWTCTILISPFVYDLIQYFVLKSNDVLGFGIIYPVTILFSLIFSTPTHVIYAFTYYFLLKKEVNLISAKAVLLTLYATGIIATFLITFGTDEYALTIPYVLTSITSGLIFKLKR